MSFQFEPDKVYEMPVFFGPVPAPKGPGPDGKYVCRKPADVEAVGVMFETDSDALEALLPERFSLNAPVLSVTHCEFSHIGNFGGNSYSLINISVPVHFDGVEEQLDGDLVLVMFENHADPIIGGRDQLGYSKIYADISPFIKDGRRICSHASSWGFRFLDLAIEPEQPAEAPERMMELAARSRGKFNYKYIQATPYRETGFGRGGADVSYPTFNPKAWNRPEGYPFTIREPEIRYCSGAVRFHRPEPADMPMYWHIGRYLADLNIRRNLGALHSFYSDPCDYSHVCRLK